MKATWIYFLVPFAFQCPAAELDSVIVSLERELQFQVGRARILLAEIEAESKLIDAQFAMATDCRDLMQWMRKSEIIRTKRVKVLNELQFDISKIRYLKGIQIIRILYEKVLSLDHHFASVKTLGEINKIANPTQYAEYQKLREMVNSERDRKTSVDLSAVLSTNPLVSLVNTFTNMLTSNLSKEEKEKELANVECVLDFTLRMQNDLNTIYFETAYLNAANNKIKHEIEVLFKDYTKPLGYGETLQKCRANDDWDAVSEKMEAYLTRMKQQSGHAQYKMQVNLEFPVDRLLQFINQYNAFIDQGGKFYEKFKIILGSYENAKSCETKLPADFQKMRSDIDLAIEKFNVAYKPVEINGSKMKEILYGLNEFE